MRRRIEARCGFCGKTIEIRLTEKEDSMIIETSISEHTMYFICPHCGAILGGSHYRI